MNEIKIHNEIIQGTDEWYDLRCGVLTASNVKHILTPDKLQFANNDKSKAHVYDIVAQRITRYVEPGYISDDMLRGIDGEKYAKDIYSEKYARVKDVGFITKKTDSFLLGYSPDGLVGEDGLIEVKTRIQKHHIKTILENEVPQEHILQIQTGLFVSERKWCDYISYCGGMPLFVKRVFPDFEMQKAIQDAAILFEEKVSELVEKYKKQAKGLYPTERITEQEILI